MNKTKLIPRYIIYLIMFIILVPLTAEAQRMKHDRGGRGGGDRNRDRGGQNRSINGGFDKPSNRDFSNANTNRNRNTSSRDVNKTNIKQSNNSFNNNLPNNNRNNSNFNSGNRNVNIDNSRNVNVNKRNVNVRANTRPYPRPPYAYGGYRYNCYHPYHYHPYHPYSWGPVWHPWGFFITTLAVTAIIVSVNNQQYHYEQGVYYIQGDGGYTVVQAPVGATIQVLPEGYQTVTVNETTNNYYYGGTYYEKTGDDYTVVPPTAGTVVENLPEGGEQEKIGDITYVRVGDTYYQPIVQDGKNMYEVANVEPVSEQN